METQPHQSCNSFVESSEHLKELVGTWSPFAQEASTYQALLSVMGRETLVTHPRTSCTVKNELRLCESGRVCFKVRWP